MKKGNDVHANSAILVGAIAVLLIAFSPNIVTTIVICAVAVYIIKQIEKKLQNTTQKK